MADLHSISDFIKRMEPHLRDSDSEIARRGSDPDLESTVEELKVAVEELRVTQEELMESALREAARQEATDLAVGLYRDAMTAAPLPLLLTDTSGVIAFANAAAGAVLGADARQLEGKPLIVFVPEEGRRAFRRVLNQMAHEASPRAFELQVAPRGRLPLEMEATVWPVPQADALTLGWRLTDVTAIRHEEADQQASATVLRAALDSLPVGVAAMDLDGSVLLWNQAARELLGWTEEEVAGRPNPAVADEAALDAVRRRGAPDAVRVTGSAERRDGSSLPVELHLAPMHDPDGGVRGTVSLIHPSECGYASSLRWPEAEMRRVLLAGVTATTLKDRLHDGITAGLHAGHLRPGDRLPSIRDAAQETGIDHRVISSAYRRLAASGLVEVKPRIGVRVAAHLPSVTDELGETAEWLAAVLEDAAELQVRVASIPELVRRWTGTVPLRCACVDTTEDGRVALCHEMQHQWGMETVPVDPRSDPEGRRELGQAMRQADLVVTTHYHAHAISPACQAQGKPLVLARLRSGVVEAVEEWLERGPLTVLVVDPAYGERLRAVRGGERVRVVACSDHAAVEALHPETPVLATLAAYQQVGRPIRLLTPATHFVAPVSARAVARLLVRANLSPRRASLV